jgi:hypothetical protein
LRNKRHAGRLSGLSAKTKTGEERRMKKYKQLFIESQQEIQRLQKVISNLADEDIE